jgi:cellulose synthase/poly-beta-1,6-N-acetylglucosamine synthase-like glycosyltransferase
MTTLAKTARRIRTGTVGVLIPAHDEEDQIEATLRSLEEQTRPPDVVVVISDNSTDRTVEIAQKCGVHVIETVGNSFKKAGALNAGIRFLLELDEFPEFIVTIDADTVLASAFIERGLHAMIYDPELGGLSAVCQGKRGLGKNPWQKALTWLQCAEYVRAGFVRIRKNIHTMSGAGSIIRSQAIFQILDDRGTLYKEHSENLVEDFETTLEIKRHLVAGPPADQGGWPGGDAPTHKPRRWKCTNNYHTVAHTDLMRTLPDLMRQRRRWVGGTIDEVRRRGWTRETRATITTIVYGYLGIPVFYLWLLLLGQNLARGATIQDLWFILCIGAYQAITLHRMGWRSMVVGFLLVPELCYMLLRHTWLFASLAHSFLARTRNWD